MLYIGVDPGQSGSIACVGDDGRYLCHQKNDCTERDLYVWLRAVIGAETVRSVFPCLAMIEHVHSMPKQGVASSFKFGQSYGFLRGLLIATDIPFLEVSPREWQNVMKCRTGGDKNVSKARAQQLFPNVTITHANADALLIAECCRLTRQEKQRC